MMGMIVEYGVNLFQAFMYIGFLYLFFDKPKGKLIRAVPFFGLLSVFFLALTLFTSFGIEFGTYRFMIETVVYICILEIYSLIFLRGKVYQRILMPIVAYVVNVILSYTFSFALSFFTGISFEAAFESSFFRYICMVVINLTCAVAFWVIARFGSERLRLRGAAEIIAFIVIPVLCLVIMFCDVFVFQVSGLNADILPYLLTIFFVMVFIAVLVGFMLVRLSRANAQRTEYELTVQREKLYKESMLATNEQIDRISGIKHDMKNTLITIGMLVEKGDTEEAARMCRESSQKLRSTYTPLSTENPVLNAIVNVELEKASQLSVDFAVDVRDSLGFMSSSDVVSVVGNLCDNAMEYLVTQDESIRKLRLNIRIHGNLLMISCRNMISSSVLEGNMELKTTKADKKNHGKGIGIVRNIAKEHKGELKFSEENGWLEACFIMPKE